MHKYLGNKTKIKGLNFLKISYQMYGIYIKQKWLAFTGILGYDATQCLTCVIGGVLPEIIPCFHRE